MGTWLIAIAACVVGLAGLGLAALGLDVGIEMFGCGVFALGTLAVFRQMKKDDAAAGPQPSGLEAPAE